MILAASSPASSGSVLFVTKSHGVSAETGESFVWRRKLYVARCQ